MSRVPTPTTQRLHSQLQIQACTEQIQNNSHSPKAPQCDDKAPLHTPLCNTELPNASPQEAIVPTINAVHKLRGAI